MVVVVVVVVADADDADDAEDADDDGGPAATAADGLLMVVTAAVTYGFAGEEKLMITRRG